MKHFILAMSLVCLISQSASAIEVSGVNLPDQVTLGEEQLLLNGYGIRKKYFFKIYLGSLYSTGKITSTQQVLDSRGGKMVRLDFFYKKLERARMVGGFAKGIENNSPELAKDPAIVQFLGWFDSDFVEGDRVELAISADDLVSVTHNSRLLGTVRSSRLAKAILLIYLGSEPVDEDMKAGMLGKD